MDPFAQYIAAYLLPAPIEPHTDGADGVVYGTAAIELDADPAPMAFTARIETV